MLIQEKPVQHWIDNFYGYGSWKARIWFIDHEESGGDVPEEEASKFNYFYTVNASSKDALCDIRDMYQQVGLQLDGPRAGLIKNFFDYRFSTHAVQHGVWKNLIAFAHGFRNEGLPDVMEYQRSLFASPSIHNEALMSLFPLPTHNHAWYYSWLDLPQLPFLKSRTLFQEHVYSHRIHRILQNIREYKPDVVLMYDLANINTIKKSVQDFFPDSKFKMVKALKLKIPQHHVADLDGTKLLLTTQIPTLRHNRIETGFDWEELGKSVR
jgi:hypothetical protein